jgi:hypothetical protein
MGRGRAKAKQTKVARELKYHTQPTDLTALQRELSAASADRDHTDGDDLSGGYDGDRREAFGSAGH